MLAFRSAAIALAGSLVVSNPASAFLTPALLAVKAKAGTNTHHIQHLLQAEKDLLAAESAIGSKNAVVAHKAVSSAVHQVEQAVTHHHAHFVVVPLGSGWEALILKAKHQHHHGLFTEAVTHLKSAEKQLKTGNGTGAVQHIEAGGKMIQASIASHYQLIGR